MSEAAALARRFVAAHNAHDVSGMLALLAEPFEYRDPAAPASVRTRADLADLYTGIFGAFPDIRFDVTDVFAGDDGAFLVFRTTGTGAGVFAGKDVRGRVIDVEEAGLFRVSGDRIWLVHFFSDTLTLDRQLGGYH
jgi:steroid delta-isomerase-like uncharacterized protein